MPPQRSKRSPKSKPKPNPQPALQPDPNPEPKTNVKLKHRQLLEQFHIHFDSPVQSPFTCPEHWPASRGRIVQDIRTLGRMSYDEYQARIQGDHDAALRPWRGQLRRRAEHVAALAQTCRAERDNEAEWRAKLEAKVLARFEVEVACKTCRKRLWRSEQEVDPGHAATDNAARSLEQRQQDRKPCVCNPTWFLGDPGINPLFKCRLEHGIAYPPEVKDALSKIKEIPDRVHGLRATKRLKRILSSAAITDITTHPFLGDSEPVHFPFLVLEAKSEKGADSLMDAALQTAFSIRELLVIQDGLRLAAGEDADEDTDPLVWFLCNKGEDWSVCIGYIEPEDDCKHVRVTQLWRGAINENENALRLLLIVDYIVDWARDIYREGVIQGLMKATGLDSRSLVHQDSDILSTVGFVPRWILDQQNRVESGRAAGQERALIEDDALRSFDTAQGVIRDIRYIRSRFVGFHLTRDNVGDFFSMMGSEQAQIYAGYLIAMIDSPQVFCRVKGETLTALESDWTGKDRGLECQDQEATFAVCATVAAYLTPDWEQTREFSYLAVDVGIMPQLYIEFNGQDLHPGVPQAAAPSPSIIGMDAFRAILREFRCQPAGANLWACISGVHLRALPPFAHHHATDGCDLRLISGVWRNVWRTGKDRWELQIGSKPSWPFLRVSSALDELDLFLDGPSSLCRHVNEEASRWFRDTPDRSPNGLPEIPRVPDHGVLIATPRNHSTAPLAARLCLFVTKPVDVRSGSSLFRELQGSEPPWVLHPDIVSDRKTYYSYQWNHAFGCRVKFATRDDAVLPRLRALVRGLEMLEDEGESGPRRPSSPAQKRPAAPWRIREAESASMPAPKRQRLAQPVPSRIPSPVPETLLDGRVARRLQTAEQESSSSSTSLQDASQASPCSPGSSGGDANPVV